MVYSVWRYGYGKYSIRVLNMHSANKKNSIFLALISLLAFSGYVAAQEKIIELNFGQAPISGSDISRTLQSLVKVRDIGEQYATGGLYLITHYGDREELFRKENQKAMDHPWINDTWRFCSAFSTRHGNSVLMGRNWDNQNVGSIIINLYHPAKGYSSICFSRAIDLGFPLNMDLEEITGSPWGERLLLAPFYTMGGMNEHGLAIENPGVRQATIKPVSGKEWVFQTYLIRKILDQAKNVEEAVSLAEKYLPFDIGKNALNAHLFIVDASGRSVVLEYEQDQWRKIYGDRSWQVITNKPVYNVPDTKLREQCWRYKSLAEALDRTEGEADWKAGLKILQDVSQKGTTWSVVYSLPTKELYFSVYQKWDVIYHLKGF
jgi:hypothetical protein